MSFLMTTIMPAIAWTGGLLAQTAPATGPAGGAPATPKPSMFEQLFMSPLFLPIALLIVLYIFIFRSKRKQESQRRELLNAVKRGDKIQTIGGIIGTVTSVEDNRVQVKVDESSNTKIWFARSAVHRVYSADETEKPETK